MVFQDPYKTRSAPPRQRDHRPKASEASDTTVIRVSPGDLLPIYGPAYLHRLRQAMRASLVKAEQASVDWNGLNDQHNARTSDPGQRFLNKQKDISGIGAAYDEASFHRDWTVMLGTVLQAEMACWNRMPRIGGSL